MTSVTWILLLAVLYSIYLASTTEGITETHKVIQQRELQRDAIDADCSDESIEQQLSAIFCDPKYAQPLVDELAGCGSVDALSIVDSCRRLPNGTHCSDIAGQVDALTAQANELCGERCTAECRRALKDLASLAGCCANSIITQAEPLNSILDPEVWTRCNVDSPGVCPSVLKSLEVNRTHCSSEAISQAYIKHVDCGSPYYDILGRCSPHYLDFKKHYCAVDENNVTCYNHINDRSSQQLVNINVICNDSRSCSSQCQGLLQEIKGTYSCCLNFYNNSMSLSPEESFIFSHDFWKLCQVETPGDCHTSPSSHMMLIST